MISDHYPPLSGCDREGLSGNCGPECRVFKDGDCPVEDEIVDGWLLTCHDATGRPELEEGGQYRVETKPGVTVTLDGREYLMSRFWMEPIILSEQ